MDPVTIALLCVVGGLLLLVHLRQLRERSKNAKLAPGALPLVGHSFMVLNAQPRLLEWLYGGTMWAGGAPWSFKVLGTHTFICVSSPDAVKHILKDNFDNYIKGYFFIDRFWELLGDGIFDVDGAEWSYQRKTASHIFKGNELKGFMAEVFHEHCRLAVERIEHHIEKGEAFDIQDLFSRYTLESIGQIGYGIHLGCFDDLDSSFMRHFDAAQNILMDRAIDPLWEARKWLKWIHPGERQLTKHIKFLDTFARNVIKQRRDEDDLRDREDLLSRFMALRDESGKPLDDDRLRDVIMSFVIAGRDTTANCLTWTIYELSQNKAARDKLVAEIDSVVGKGDVTYKTVAESLPYVHKVVKEVLRLHPSVPKDIKVAVEEDELPDGTHIPKGALVIYMPWVMGRLETIYDDPMKFDPDRWDTISKTHYEFTAFNAGPRLCLGMNMAYLEAKFMIVNLFQHFNLTVQEGQSFRPQQALAMPMENGLFVKAALR